MGRRNITRAWVIVLSLALSAVGAESGDDELLDLDEFLQQEEIEPLAPIAEEGLGDEAFFGGDVILGEEALHGCDTCQDLWVDDCGGCPTRAPAFCPWSWGYVKTDYLMWWTKGMGIPPLVTTSRNGVVSREVAGVLDRPATDVIFGDRRILKEERSGGRLIVGAWRDPCQGLGVEGDYIALGTVGTRFAASSDGDPILARPFFNVLTEEQDSELTAYPDVAEGSVGVNAFGRFTSAGVRLRWNKGCQPICFQLDGWRPETFRGHRRWGLLMGYRYVRMDESLIIREQLTSMEETLPVDFDILDVFDTQNSFHGGELGVAYEAQYNRWSLEMLGKIAFGNSHEVVFIDGSTDIAIQGTDLVDSYSGGILAQRTNMGTYSRDRFAVVPEASATLGYQLTRCLRATLGYTFIFWSRVARPGDQIDLALNPNLFPPEEDPFSGPLRPAFSSRDSRFWAQGISFGLDYRW